MINISDIAFKFHTTPIFDHFSWTVERNESWVILGPSGCGKSTLLSLLAGLRFPSAGTIKINGIPLTRPRPKSGLILQDYGLLPWATVRENANLGLELRSFYGADGIHAPLEKEDISRAEAWLERLGLSSVLDKYPAQISGGQRQRTAIARTLTLNPDLLLMDEPFSSLDAPSREALQRLTIELVNEQELTLILVTHSIEEAALLGRKILILSQPPNKEVYIIDNPNAGEVHFREEEEYFQLCRSLRQFLDPSRDGRE